MSYQLADSFVEHFQTVKDPRRKAGLRHPLTNILFIAICAIVCGADDWVAVERFGNANRAIVF